MHLIHNTCMVYVHTVKDMHDVSFAHNARARWMQLTTCTHQIDGHHGITIILEYEYLSSEYR